MKDSIKHRKNILFAIGSMRPGGAERVLSILSNELALTGRYQIRIFCFQEGKSFYNLSPEIQLSGVNLAPNSTSVTKRIQMLVGLRREINNFLPDVIISFITESTLMVYWARIFKNIPIIASEHGVFRSKGRTLDLLRKFVFKRIEHVVCLNQHDLQEIRTITPKVSIIYNPAPFDQSCSIHRDFFALCVASLDRYVDKGLVELIQIWPEVVSQHPEFGLVIVGGGLPDNVSILRELIAKHNMTNNVFLEGFQEDMCSWYQRAKILVSASKIECLPMNLIEAQSQGCPVVACDCPYGPREIIENNVNGILVPNKDYVALKQRVLELLDDSSLYHEISKNGLDSSDRFSRKTITSQWINLIEKVLHKKAMY